MRHRIKGYKLNRDTTNRKALFKSLVTALLQAGEIRTTETKAKAVKGLADKLIHRAQEGSVTTRRLLARFFGRRDLVNHLVDVVAPTMTDRNSGFTRITRLGKRQGDDAMIVKLELVKKSEKVTQLQPVESKEIVKEKKVDEKKKTKSPAKKKVATKADKKE